MLQKVLGIYWYNHQYHLVDLNKNRDQREFVQCVA